MFFRFGSALALVVVVSLAATTLEKRSLELRRAITRQHYRLQVLEDAYLAQRVSAQQLVAPARLIGTIDPALLAPPQSRSVQPARPARSQKKRKPSGAAHR
ncbi:MAG: hypothetical protein ACT4QC_03530 [Planctomycetaceae bacterium]